MIAASPLVRLEMEHLPLAEHLSVGLELRACLRVADPVLYAAFIEMVHHDGVERRSLQVRPNRDEQQVDRIVLFQRPEHVDPAEREKPSAMLLHGRMQEDRPRR